MGDEEDDSCHRDNMTGSDDNDTVGHCDANDKGLANVHSDGKRYDRATDDDDVEVYNKDCNDDKD